VFQIFTQPFVFISQFVFCTNAPCPSAPGIWSIGCKSAWEIYLESGGGLMYRGQKDRRAGVKERKEKGK